MIAGDNCESGFPDAILQRWAAFRDELAHGADGMRQPPRCVTPDEAFASHRLFPAALESHRTGGTIRLEDVAGT